MDIKLCNKCGETKSIKCFSKRGKIHQAWCKACAAEHNKQYHRDNVDTIRPRRQRNKRKWAYGLTEDDFNTLLVSQNYLCACCGLVEPKHIDHDHSCCPGEKTCGKCVRGLLCVKCNTFIGFIEKNPKLIDQAKNYLN